MSGVKGTMMLMLKEYVAKASPDEIESRLSEWRDARRAMAMVATNLDAAAKNLGDAFEDTSLTTAAARRAFTDASSELTQKVGQLDAAIDALGVAKATTKRAQDKHTQLEASLPASHGPAPDASAQKYAQTGSGIDSAQAVTNQKALHSDQAAWRADEQAIADAETAAAQQIKAVDDDNYTADPPVRAITDEPSAVTGKAPAGASSPGSYSDIAAARARAAGYNSGVMYPSGWGHDLKAAEMENIKAYEAENKPEWDGKQWINADGSAAPATSYAMVESADGLAPLAGGTGGMTALAVGGGGALLGAGAAKALASKFAAASAKATPAATSKSATARSAAAKAGAAGSRAGAAGRAAGARGAGAGAGARGAGARGAGGRGATGAGSRAGRAGAGAGRGGAGAGRGGRKRDERQNGQDQDWQADYTDDWTESASDVLDPGTARGWAPEGTKNDGTR